MIKIDQTIVDKDNGNCMQAVLASLFEKNLDETISIMDYPDPGWFEPLVEWLNSIGYKYSGIYNHLEKEESLKDLTVLSSVGGFFYGVVPSRNFEDVTHAVIINQQGIVVHDPNPKKQWLGEDVISSGDLSYWYVFDKTEDKP